MRTLALLLAVASAGCFVDFTRPSDGAPAPGATAEEAALPAATPAPAGTDGGCTVAGECASGICNAGACAAPSPTDGVKNGDETDVDCGGATAPKCAAGKACSAHGDCTSGACPAGLCSESPSCKQKMGGATCGAGEVGAADAKHEDCCASAIVPRDAKDGGPFRMDRYLITAGRVRTFLESVGYDARGWVNANKPTWWKGNGVTTWEAMLPSNKQEFLHFMTDGGSGCFVGPKAGENGAPAYWAPAEELASTVQGAPRVLTKDQLDTKVMNCFRAPLLHALCAFDGGRLASRTEWIAARTVDGKVRPYPWGTEGTDADRRARAVYDFNYRWPRAPQGAETDFGGFLPAPGRFPLGNGPYGHADLLGSVENAGVKIAADGSATGDGWFQFSFQEPEIAAHPYGDITVQFGTGAYRNHWSVGGRCVKD